MFEKFTGIDLTCLCKCIAKLLRFVYGSLFVLCHYTQVKYGRERVQVHLSEKQKHTRSLSALKGLKQLVSSRDLLVPLSLTIPGN